jgi:hypothetical protein
MLIVSLRFFSERKQKKYEKDKSLQLCDLRFSPKIKVKETHKVESCGSKKWNREPNRNGNFPVSLTRNLEIKHDATSIFGTENFSMITKELFKSKVWI